MQAMQAKKDGLKRIVTQYDYQALSNLKQSPTARKDVHAVVGRNFNSSQMNPYLDSDIALHRL